MCVIFSLYNCVRCMQFNALSLTVYVCDTCNYAGNTQPYASSIIVERGYGGMAPLADF
jgi:hypothetical protein